MSKIENLTEEFETILDFQSRRASASIRLICWGAKNYVSSDTKHLYYVDASDTEFDIAYPPRIDSIKSSFIYCELENRLGG